MQKSIRAFAGQHNSAIGNLVTAGIQVPLVGSKPDSSNPIDAGAPVLVEVGAVVRLQGSSDMHVHVPFCSSVIDNPRIVLPGTRGYVGAAQKVGFHNRMLPFLKNPQVGDAGVLRFFGHVVRGADDQELFFRIRAAALLQIDQRICEAGAYEGSGGAEYGIESYARDNWRNLQAEGFQIEDVENVYGYSDRLFKQRGVALLVPNDEEFNDADLVAAGVPEWLPVEA